MPVQADPPFIDSAAAQAFRARLRAAYKAPSAVRPVEVFNIQEPLPPVPYFDDPPQKRTPPRTATPTIPRTATPTIPTTNSVPRFAPPSGSGGAAVVTLTGGGVISGAGLLTGGLSVLAGGLLVYNARELYKLFKLSQPESKPIEPESLPFNGGQRNILYNFHWEAEVYGVEPARRREYLGKVGEIGQIYGPIGGLRVIRVSLNEFGASAQIEIYGRKAPDGELGWHPVYNIGDHTLNLEKASILSITPVDGSVDPPSLPAPAPNRSPVPLGRSSPAAPPTRPTNKPFGQAPPGPTADPLATNNRIPYTITTPGSNPITFTSPGAAPVTISPSGSPATIKITRPSASPFLSPTPGSTPRATPTGDPITTPAGVPFAVSAPGSSPTNLVMPAANPITITYPGQEPIVFNPSGSSPPQGVQAAPIPKPGAFITKPAALPQTPTNPVVTPTTPTTTPTTADKPFGIDISTLNGDAQKIGLILVGISQLVKGVQTNTSTQALQAAAAAGTCSTTAPGGCSSNAMNNAVNQGNQNLLNKLGIGAQGVDLALLGVMNNKLGNQITGGLSGGLGRMSSFLGIDRALSILTFLSTVHNASMLTSSLKVTLLETLSSVGNATGLLQTSEGDNVDLNKVFNNGIEAFITSLIGTEAYASMKLTWRKYSSIYRAGSNVLSNVGNMFSSIGNGIEVIGERTGKIGNALQAASVVRENAYNYMSEKINVHTNKFMTFQTTVGGVTEVLEAINEIAESTVEGQQAYTEAVKATTEFKKELAKAEKNPGIENEAIKKEAEAIKANLVKDPTGEDETGLLSFLTDLQ